MKKIIALLMATVMVFALAACGGGTENAADTGNTNAGNTNDGNTNAAASAQSLKIWAAQEDQAIMQQFSEQFKAANPQYNVTFEFGVVGEPDCYTRFSEDPAAAADVFFFPNDQLRDFVRSGGLYEVTRNKDAIISRNMESSIEAATLNGKLWGYPSTADNGYFLYYDTSVLTKQDVQSLDRILEVCNAAGKKITMNLDNNGWYVASFFLGAGCTLSIGPDDIQVCDFNNANGLAAARAMQAFTSNSAFLEGNDDVLKGGIGGTIAAGISGTWNAEDISSTLGDNYGAAKLPTFTMNGNQVQMGSFGGYKIAGVNSTITDRDKLVIAFDFADFITNEQSQVARFEARAIGPSNINAASDPAVQENLALAALAAQSVHATSQNDVLGTYWNPAGAFGTAIVNNAGSDLQELLDNMVAQIQT